MTDEIKTDQPVPMPADPSLLATRQGAAALVSVLVMRLGGRIVLSPDEFHAIQGTTLMESSAQDRTGHPGATMLCVWVEPGQTGMGKLQ